MKKKYLPIYLETNLINHLLCKTKYFFIFGRNHSLNQSKLTYHGTYQHILHPAI